MVLNVKDSNVWNDLKMWILLTLIFLVLPQWSAIYISLRILAMGKYMLYVDHWALNMNYFLIYKQCAAYLYVLQCLSVSWCRFDCWGHHMYSFCFIHGVWGRGSTLSYKNRFLITAYDAILILKWLIVCPSLWLF